MITRVVVDANVYVSALIKAPSPPSLVLQTLVENNSYELVLSQEILDELKRVIFYPKVRKIIKKSDEDICLWLEAFTVVAYTSMLSFSHSQTLVLEDPTDDIYILAALESRSKYIVSGDKHLLNLQKHEGIKIARPSDFLRLEQLA